MFSGKALTKARQKAGMSLAQVARMLGVSRQAVHSWEQGLSMPSPRNIEKLTLVFGCLETDERIFARRVGVCGAHGVGKTTLARTLAERLHLPLLSEVARFVIPRYVDRCEDLLGHPEALTCQFEIMFEQMRMEANLCTFVSDRTVLDVLAYTYYLDVLPSLLCEPLERGVMTYTRNYDVIVYCPIVGPPADDGFRYTSQESQEAIDRILCSYLLPQAECEVLCLNSDRGRWVEQVLDFIGQRRKTAL